MPDFVAEFLVLGFPLSTFCLPFFLLPNYQLPARNINDNLN